MEVSNINVKIGIVHQNKIYNTFKDRINAKRRYQKTRIKSPELEKLLKSTKSKVFNQPVKADVNSM